MAPPEPHCFFLPPHILSRIAEAGTAPQRAWAREQLLVSERIRGQRDLLSAFAPVLSIMAAPLRDRMVYDAGHRTTLPGKIVRREGDDPSSDPVVDEAYDYSGHTYDFFRAVLGRQSIDDRGMSIHSTVHYGVRYSNAFWNGRQMVYGDGDGVIFDRFTASLDVVAHELTHGVTQYEAALDYQDQPGALNEHFSDVFGSLVRQWVANQTAEEADWLVGAGIFLPKSGVVRRAIRSMSEPGTAYDDPLLGKDPQPAHTRDYDPTTSDNGGVHINSGIPNRAFFLAATALGGYAWERAGQIWYETLCNRLRPTSDFQECARHSVSVAGDLFGRKAQSSVRSAWAAVGVPLQTGARRPSAPVAAPAPEQAAAVRR